MSIDMPSLCKGCPEAKPHITPLWSGSIVYKGCDGSQLEECMKEARQ